MTEFEDIWSRILNFITYCFWQWTLHCLPVVGYLDCYPDFNLHHSHTHISLKYPYIDPCTLTCMHHALMLDRGLGGILGSLYHGPHRDCIGGLWSGREAPSLLRVYHQGLGSGSVTVFPVSGRVVYISMAGPTMCCLDSTGTKDT